MNIIVVIIFKNCYFISFLILAGVVSMDFLASDGFWALIGTSVFSVLYGIDRFFRVSERVDRRRDLLTLLDCKDESGFLDVLKFWKSNEKKDAINSALKDITAFETLLDIITQSSAYKDARDRERKGSTVGLNTGLASSGLLILDFNILNPEGDFSASYLDEVLFYLEKYDQLMYLLIITGFFCVTSIVSIRRALKRKKPSNDIVSIREEALKSKANQSANNSKNETNENSSLPQLPILEVYNQALTALEHSIQRLTLFMLENVSDVDDQN